MLNRYIKGYTQCDLNYIKIIKAKQIYGDYSKIGNQDYFVMLGSILVS